MSKIRLKYIIFFFTIYLLGVTGCATLSGTAFSELKEVPPGKSLIYVYWQPSDHVTDFSLTVDDVFVVDMMSGGYIPIIVDAKKVKLEATLNFGLFKAGLLDVAMSTPAVIYVDAKSIPISYIECLAVDKFNLNFISIPENNAFMRISNCKLLQK